MTVLCKSKISRETASYIVDDGVGNFLPTPTSVTSYPQSLHRLSSYPPSYAPFKPLCPNTLGKAAIESKTLNAETKRGGWSMGTLIPASLARVWPQGLASEDVLASTPQTVSSEMISVRSSVFAGDRHFTARKYMPLGCRQMKYPKTGKTTVFFVLCPGIPRPDDTFRIVARAFEAWVVPRSQTRISDTKANSGNYPFSRLLWLHLSAIDRKLDTMIFQAEIY
jgi:hypothetical protein